MEVTDPSTEEKQRNTQTLETYHREPADTIHDFFKTSRCDATDFGSKLLDAQYNFYVEAKEVFSSSNIPRKVRDAFQSLMSEIYTNNISDVEGKTMNIYNVLFPNITEESVDVIKNLKEDELMRLVQDRLLTKEERENQIGVGIIIDCGMKGRLLNRFAFVDRETQTLKSYPHMAPFYNLLPICANWDEATKVKKRAYCVDIVPTEKLQKIPIYGTNLFFQLHSYMSYHNMLETASGYQGNLNLQMLDINNLGVTFHDDNQETTTIIPHSLLKNEFFRLTVKNMCVDVKNYNKDTIPRPEQYLAFDALKHFEPTTKADYQARMQRLVTKERRDKNNVFFNFKRSMDAGQVELVHWLNHNREYNLFVNTAYDDRGGISFAQGKIKGLLTTAYLQDILRHPEKLKESALDPSSRDYLTKGFIHVGEDNPGAVIPKIDKYALVTCDRLCYLKAKLMNVPAIYVAGNIMKVFQVETVEPKEMYERKVGYYHDKLYRTPLTQDERTRFYNVQQEAMQDVKDNLQEILLTLLRSMHAMVHDLEWSKKAKRQRDGTVLYQWETVIPSEEEILRLVPGDVIRMVQYARVAEVKKGNFERIVEAYKKYVLQVVQTLLYIVDQLPMYFEGGDEFDGILSSTSFPRGYVKLHLEKENDVDVRTLLQRLHALIQEDVFTGSNTPASTDPIPSSPRSVTSHSYTPDPQDPSFMPSITTVVYPSDSDVSTALSTAGVETSDTAVNMARMHKKELFMPLRVVYDLASSKVAATSKEIQQQARSFWYTTKSLMSRWTSPRSHPLQDLAQVSSPLRKITMEGGAATPQYTEEKYTFLMGHMSALKRMEQYIQCVRNMPRTGSYAELSLEEKAKYKDCLRPETTRRVLVTTQNNRFDIVALSTNAGVEEPPTEEETPRVELSSRVPVTYKLPFVFTYLCSALDIDIHSILDSPGDLLMSEIPDAEFPNRVAIFKTGKVFRIADVWKRLIDMHKVMFHRHLMTETEALTHQTTLSDLIVQALKDQTDGLQELCEIFESHVASVPLNLWKETHTTDIETAYDACWKGLQESLESSYPRVPMAQRGGGSPTTTPSSLHLEDEVKLMLQSPETEERLRDFVIKYLTVYDEDKSWIRGMNEDWHTQYKASIQHYLKFVHGDITFVRTYLREFVENKEGISRYPTPWRLAIPKYALTHPYTKEVCQEMDGFLNVLRLYTPNFIRRKVYQILTTYTNDPSWNEDNMREMYGNNYYLWTQIAPAQWLSDVLPGLFRDICTQVVVTRNEEGMATCYDLWQVDTTVEQGTLPEEEMTETQNTSFSILQDQFYRYYALPTLSPTQHHEYLMILVSFFHTHFYPALEELHAPPTTSAKKIILDNKRPANIAFGDSIEDDGPPVPEQGSENKRQRTGGGVTNDTQTRQELEELYMFLNNNVFLREFTAHMFATLYPIPPPAPQGGAKHPVKMEELTLQDYHAKYYRPYLSLYYQKKKSAR